MGRSAKLMKRPTKAEKVSRQLNAPPQTSTRRERSLSPDDGPRSAIPLFNTSAKRRLQQRLQDYDPMSLDSSKAPSPATSDGMEEDEQLAAQGSAQGTTAEGKKKKSSSFKDKIKSARQAVEEAQLKGKSKLSGKPITAATSASEGAGTGKKNKHILGGKDYLKTWDKREVGMSDGFRKKLR
ncbi:hypothetical protein T439DRAFT_4873 [Meredithblackwellia eburnea MCA 4105]